LPAARQSVQPWEAIYVTPEGESRPPVQDSKITPMDWISRVAQEIATYSKRIKTRSANAW
jgi:hypothetical protein